MKTTRLLSLFTFSLLNAIDLVQTISFLKMGIESNLFAVYYPEIWFPLKFAFTFGLPICLLKLDNYSRKREYNSQTLNFLDLSVMVMYIIILIADLFYIQLVLRNISILGRIL